MKRNVKLPKTYTMFVTTENEKTGYVRFRSYLDDSGKISLTLKLVKRISEASHFVNLDNSKIEAKRLKDEHGFKRMELIDETSKKHYVIH